MGGLMHTLADAADREHLHARLAALEPGDVGLWGVLSAAEMVCHMRGAFLAAMGEIPSTPVAVGVPQKDLKAAALWVPVPWKHNFPTLPALRQGMPALRTGLFAADVADARAQMERFCAPGQMRVDHGFFGAMSYLDWTRWGFLHTDHHLRQFGR